MSELDECIEYAESEHPFEAYDARTELAQLRDDSLLLIGSNRLLSEIGDVLNCPPDATILDRIGVLHDTVAEQARAVEEARKVVMRVDEFMMREGVADAVSKADMMLALHGGSVLQDVKNWLAAHPAPADEAQP